MARKPAIVRGIVNTCWFVFKCCLALGLAAAVGAACYYYQQVDNELRRHVVEKFSRHYPNLSITVRSVARIKGKGIEVRGLSIVEPGATGPRAELAYFDEMFLACDESLPGLLAHEPQVSQVIVRRPIFQATRRPDGTWSTAQLLPLPEFGQHPPEVIVENCAFEFFDPLRQPSSTLAVRDVNLVISAAPDAARLAAGASHQVRGHFLGDFCQRVEFEGELADGGRQWQFHGRADGLDLSPELSAALPSGLAERLDVLKSVRLLANLRFEISQDARRDVPFFFALQGNLVRGRVEDPRLPYPLTDVSATLECDNQGIRLHNLRARNGQTFLLVKEAWRRGFAADSPLYLEAHCEHLVIDRDLLERLPERWRAKWREHFLAGTVDAHLKLAFDGAAWHPDLTINCVDTSYTYHKFPYRLEGGRGSLRLKDDMIDLSLTAFSGADQVSLAGRFEHLDQDPGVWFEVHAENLAIDQKLLRALPSGPREVIGALRPYGRFSFFANFSKPPGAQAPLENRAVVKLQHCSLRYDKFPYPVDNVRGTIMLDNGVWVFQDLSGTNDTGEIECRGSLGPATGGHQLVLNFLARNIALEEELRTALPEHLQQLWSDLKPHGLIDLETEVRYTTGTRDLSVGVRAVPIGDTASIEPSYFPYRLEKLAGELRYRDGRLEFKGFKARHLGVEVAARGTCNLAPDGRWRMRLDDLVVYRLRADRELQMALPARLKEWVRKLDPGGPFNLSGSVELAGSGVPGVPPSAQWNLDLAFQQCALNCGVHLEHVSGEMNLAGGFDGRHFGSHVELDIDSLVCRDLQLTELRGPMWVDERRVLLGSWAQRTPRGGEPRHLTAKAYGGRCVGDGWVLLDSTPRFTATATVTDADLARSAQEVLAGRQKLSGKILAGVNLRGTAEGVHTLSGTGYVRLRDADIYRLPQMVSLLKIVSLKPPDDAAFTTSDIDFRVDGDHLYFDRIDFHGDAISLKGRGEMNFASDVACTFYALVGRDELPIPLVPDLFRAASQQIMLIHVGGKLREPDIRRDPFPGVNQALHNLQVEFERPPNPGGLAPSNNFGRAETFGPAPPQQQQQPGDPPAARQPRVPLWPRVGVCAGL